jgi:hypothetical protein
MTKVIVCIDKDHMIITSISKPGYSFLFASYQPFSLSVIASLTPLSNFHDAPFHLVNIYYLTHSNYILLTPWQ